MRTTLDILAELEQAEKDDAGQGISVPRYSVGMRKPTQRLMREQVFGEPESEEEKELMELLKIRRTQQ
jgi:hypothetical protein